MAAPWRPHPTKTGDPAQQPSSLAQQDMIEATHCSARNQSTLHQIESQPTALPPTCAGRLPPTQPPPITPRDSPNVARPPKAATRRGSGPSTLGPFYWQPRTVISLFHSLSHSDRLLKVFGTCSNWAGYGLGHTIRGGGESEANLLHLPVSASLALHSLNHKCQCTCK
jgi:hypothetical protein